MSKRKIDQRPAMMVPIQKAASPVPARKHNGFVDVLRKVAPFLFHEKKAVQKAAAPMKVVVKKQEIRNKKQTKPTKIRQTKTKKSSKKTSNHTLKTKKSAKASVSVPVARKTVTPKTTTSASNVLAAKTIEKPSPVDTTSFPAQKPSAIDAFDEPKGVLLINDDEKKKQEQAATEKLKASAVKDALEQEEGWMEKVVKSQKSDAKDIKKHSAWSMLIDRFSFGKDKAPVAKAPVLTDKELKEDDFLKRVQKKKETSVVGTSTDDENAPPSLPGMGDRKPRNQEASPASALENFADGVQEKPAKTAGKKQDARQGRIISAAELHKETEAAKAAAKRLEEATRQEMIAEEKTKKASAPKVQEETPKPVDDTPVVRIKNLPKGKSILSQVMASLSHIGLGKESMQFIENLSTMLNAGLPLIDALETLQSETRSKPMKKMMKRILETVENGSPLWKALDAEDFFSLHAIALIRIGEEAGNLAQNMEYLAIQEEKDHELKSKVSMAMIYPAIVMTIMFIIVMGLGLFVLPNLMGVLTSLNVPLPLTTRLMISFSNAFTKYANVVVPGMIGGFIVFIFLAKFTRLKVAVQWVQFKIPGIGSLARSSTIARFGVILGGLLRAGVPVVEAVQSLVDVTPIVAYRKLYEKLLDHITIGDSFAKSFTSIKGSEKLLPPSVQQLVITGEKSGALATIMLKIADIYDKKASETAQKLPVILEPMILLVIGALVGTIAFSVIVPIYSIVGSVGH